MHHRSQMRVVVFEDIGADRVQERGMKRVRRLATPDYGSLRRPEERRQHPDRDLHRLVTRATERTADKVQQPAHPSRRTSGGMSSHCDPATNCASVPVTCG